jgi:hypothetical protein
VQAINSCRNRRDPFKRALAVCFALTVAFSAGVHAALVPEHLREIPPLGYLFIVAAAVGAAIATALVTCPSARILRLAAVFLVTQVIASAVFIGVHISGLTGTPEPVEPIALVCKATELLGIALAIPPVVRATGLGRSIR